MCNFWQKKFYLYFCLLSQSHKKIWNSDFFSLKEWWKNQIKTYFQRSKVARVGARDFLGGYGTFFFKIGHLIGPKSANLWGWPCHSHTFLDIFSHKIRVTWKKCTWLSGNDPYSFLTPFQIILIRESLLDLSEDTSKYKRIQFNSDNEKKGMDPQPRHNSTVHLALL